MIPGLLKYESYAASSAFTSDSPQLIETTVTPFWPSAYATAAIRLDTVAELASTTRMFAPGAIECAHSTSSASSSAQPAFVFFEAFGPVARLTCVSVGDDVPPIVGLTVSFVRLNWVSNPATSCARFGFVYASISAIVWPAPVSVVPFDDFRLFRP